MADVLSVIRDYHVNKKDVDERDEIVVFGDQAWPKTAKTNYVAYGTGKDNVAKEYYTVDCILFLLKNVHLPHAMYVRQAASGNVPVVRRPDRKDLLSYLSGETTSSTSIDKSAPLELPFPAPKANSAAGAVAVATKRVTDESDDHQKKRQKLDEEKVLRDKERLAAKLDGPKTAGPTAIPASENSTISTMLTKEQIAAMKAKRLATKRTTIKADDESAAFEQRSFVDSEVAVTADIISKERLWHTRITVLQSSGKQFAQNIFGILASLKAREEGKNATVAPSVAAVIPTTQVKPVQHTTYNRYEQETFKQKEETDEFRIDVTKTFQGASLKSVTEGTTTNRKPPEQPKQLPRPISDARPPQGAKKSSRTPIIIIPASTTSLIQMINVKDLLQDLKYVPVEQKKAEGVKRDNEVLIQRKKNDVTVSYRVIDNPLKLQEQDWDRVVAVFAQGPAWQFKSWPFGGNPVELFTKMKAFHIQMSDLPVETNIKNWDVTILKLDRNKRHLDRAVLQAFWDVLDRFVAKSKTHLRV